MDSKLSLDTLKTMINNHNEIRKAYNVAKLKRIASVATARYNDMLTLQKNIHDLCQSLYLRQIGFNKVCIEHKYVQSKTYDEMKIDM